MKILFMLATFLIGNSKNLFKQHSSALTEQIVLNVRALATIILSSVGALALFCSGFYMLLSHIAVQWDQNGGLHFSATLIISAALTLVSLGTLIYCLKPTTWLKATGLQQPPPQNSARASGKASSPIEGAVANLIMDFVHQREQSRKSRQNLNQDSN
jgi:hypothetical protein